MTRPFSAIAREIIIRCIVNCDDPQDRKERILIARQQGVIRDSDAELLLKLYELEAA